LGEREADLAIIDLRLEGERDDDFSGLDLAAETGNGSIPIIILTGVAKRKAEAALRALQKKGRISPAVEVVDKTKGPKNLLKVVHRVIVPKVFLVHGHDEDAREAVVGCLEGEAFHVIVLQEEPGTTRTIIEKVEKHANAHFAIILITPDDFGGNRTEPSIQMARARQNVIFEYGFFLGKLGRDRVVALHRGEKVELPSDCEGIQLLAIDPGGRWQAKLLRELEAALDLERLPR
jgi:predicted nucleotide-binding protein